MIQDPEATKSKEKKKKLVMMVGTALGNKGGIESVIQGYFDCGITENLRIDYYPTHRDGTRTEKVFYYIQGLVNIFIKIRNYEIVHVHTASKWSYRRLFTVLLLTKVLKKRVVIHVHGAKFDVYYSKAGFYEKPLIRYGFHIADKVVVLSAEWLKKITPFCDSNKITIIPNTVAQHAIKHHQLDKQLIIPHTILFMGVLGPRKGVYDLLDAIRILNLDKSKAKVRLCGNGEIEKVKNRVVDLGLEEIVEVPGWIDGEERRRSLNEAYLYVLPSYFEGLPMSILEALATGTPVIATPVGGIPELITHGYNGFLVPTKSPQQLADRIEQVLDDKNLWKTMSDNALITIREKFAMEHAERKLRILYESLAS